MLELQQESLVSKSKYSMGVNKRVLLTIAADNELLHLGDL
jgi:hypothetical protein